MQQIEIAGSVRKRWWMHALHKRRVRKSCCQKWLRHLVFVWRIYLGVCSGATGTVFIVDSGWWNYKGHKNFAQARVHVGVLCGYRVKSELRNVLIGASTILRHQISLSHFNWKSELLNRVAVHYVGPSLFIGSPDATTRPRVWRWYRLCELFVISGL